MKKISIFLAFLPLCFFAQNRNETVRKLNDIISLMDEASRLNQTYYFDAIQLAKAIDISKTKINPNYFYTKRK